MHRNDTGSPLHRQSRSSTNVDGLKHNLLLLCPDGRHMLCTPRHPSKLGYGGNRLCLCLFVCIRVCLDVSVALVVRSVRNNEVY